MLTGKISSAVAGLILATAFGANGFGSEPVRPKSHTYDITFDGFCDGVNLTLSNKYYIVGQSTGCSAGAVDEGFTATRSGVKYLDISSNNNGGDQALTFVFDLPISTGRGWCVYNTTDGVTQNVLNCGTYTVDAPGPRGPFPSSRPDIAH